MEKNKNASKSRMLTKSNLANSARLTGTFYRAIISKILKGDTAMAVHNSMFNMVMLQQRVEIAQISPGLYCRTQISE